MGAWQHIYKTGLSGAPGTPTGYGILAIKNELIYNGFGQGVDPEYKDKNGNYFFGSGAAAQAQAYQQSVGITADGEIGPVTAQHLFRKRAKAAGTRLNISGDLLCKLKTLESNNDPAAVGAVDPLDFGLMQIHMPFHPDVSTAEAFDPAFAISWGGDYLRNNYDVLGDWDAAVASYNVGLVYARQWLRAGKPNSGGTILSSGVDIFTRAFQYVALVKSQKC